MDVISSEARAEIERRLATIAREDGIRFLMAIESGSRAWGFPSPDSDYDVRFIYARRPRDYVTLRPARDVVERPIVDDYDINGWDITKTLGLLLKHNAVVAEWLDSPIRYVAENPAVQGLRELADRFFDPRGYALHYASLGENNVARWQQSDRAIPAKRYFYALRPALSVRVLRLSPDRRPPMRLQDLMARADLSAELTAEIDRLVELKGQQREKADTKRSKSIEDFIVTELARAAEIPERRADAHFLEQADEIFRAIVGVAD
ncbi:MAG: hypothetical protein B7Z08_00700 [Sphingomonadales bacterium 32-68-7]|nr:MAG: hypothetical protein B7Z33_12675 [Sphingomonadales bacterium 12-68-11]OYX10450.1 MAG: hypothetical protein B7Z08_00700 [Sphingomonadales bacterium 32-68-7]